MCPICQKTLWSCSRRWIFFGWSHSCFFYKIPARTLWCSLAPKNCTKIRAVFCNPLLQNRVQGLFRQSTENLWHVLARNYVSFSDRMSSCCFSPAKLEIVVITFPWLLLLVNPVSNQMPILRLYWLYLFWDGMLFKTMIPFYFPNIVWGIFPA